MQKQEPRPAAAEGVSVPKTKYEPPPAGGGGGATPPRALIEVFCGHAGLTMAMSEAGWVALGIDWQGNKDVPVIDRTVYIDPSTDAGHAAFWQIVRDRCPVYIHFGRPCGTASTPAQGRTTQRFYVEGGQGLRVDSLRWIIVP